LDGFVRWCGTSEMRQTFDEALKTLKALGMKTQEIEIRHMDLIPAVQAASTHAPGSELRP